MKTPLVYVERSIKQNGYKVVIKRIQILDTKILLNKSDEKKAVQ